jgi:diguanylate cyclase (GGDEF)-like protein
MIIVILLTALKRALNKERELAQKDYLTGAVNSRYFYDLLQMEINRSQRYKHPFSIAYFDVDNFKAVNDQYGHTVGDEVLRNFAILARTHLRKSDVFARLGGDEFVLLLPESDQESVQVVLSKIQGNIMEGMQRMNMPVTFSVGVLTCIDASAVTPDEILRIVDNLMYSVKRESKNDIKFSTFIKL